MTQGDELIQVGWWIPDEFQPERMSRGLWEDERLISLWTLEDNGGWLVGSEWENQAVPVYIKAAPKGA